MNFNQFLDKYQKVPVEQYPHTVSDKPLVSVCVQTYQHVDFIRQCLDGILMQKTNFDFEILLGEDASTDGTREVCIKYAQKYPDKIKLFLHHRENNISISGSPTGRFNFVYNLLSAQGKYMALCEGDDYWTDPKKLQKQVDFLEKNEEYVACYHGCMHVNEQSQVIKKSRYESYSDSPAEKLITAEAAMITHTVLFRNVIKDYPSFFFDTSSGDTLLYHLLGFYGHGKFLGDILYSAYRVHEGGIWSGINDFKRIRNTTDTLVTIRMNIEQHFGASHPYTRRMNFSLYKSIKGYLFNRLLDRDYKGYVIHLLFLIQRNKFKVIPLVRYHVIDIIRLLNKRKSF